MSAMASITYDLGDDQQRRGPLPVRIRTAEGEMVGSGVTGASIQVPPGLYYVSLITPDGRERGGRAPVEVAAGQDAVVAATIVPAPVKMATNAAIIASPEAFAMDSTEDRSLEREAAPPVAVADPGEIADARLWTGDWFPALDSGLGDRRAAVLEAGVGPVLPLSEGVPLVIEPVAGLDRMLVLQLPGVTRYTVVPFDECTACVGETPNAREIAATLVTGPTGPHVCYRSTVSEETNTLLSFVDNGVLTEMWAVSEDMVHQGERAMFGAGGSVLRAVTGAYVLLRANALEGLDSWLETLAGLSPGLPDVPILRVELLARLGMHDEAVAVLRTAVGGRLPWFRSGLSYMLERVRLYIDVSANTEVPFRIGEDEMPRFIEARDRLDRLMGVLLRGRVITTFDVPDTTSNR
jgi:hypothetical protein